MKVKKEYGFREIAIKQLKANEANPRSFARDQELEDLGRSIEAHGIIEPLIVRYSDQQDEHGNSIYEVMAGHRRLMAAEGVLEHVPCIVREVEGNGIILALVENTQRVDLTPFEQAQAIAKALTEMKQKELAAAIGRSATYVSKFATIMKAARKIAARGEDPEYFGDYTNMEELYEHAKGIVGGKQENLELGEPEEGEGEEGEATEEAGEMTDKQALERVISEQATIAKIKTLMNLVQVDAESGNTHVELTFKTMRDAEKFFQSYGIAKK